MSIAYENSWHNNKNLQWIDAKYVQDVEKVKKLLNCIVQHPVNKIDKQTGGDTRDFLTTKTGGE